MLLTASTTRLVDLYKYAARDELDRINHKTITLITSRIVYEIEATNILDLYYLSNCPD